MVAFSSAQIIEVFLLRWRTKEFLKRVTPVSILSRFDSVKPSPEYEGALIKWKRHD